MWRPSVHVHETWSTKSWIRARVNVDGEVTFSKALPQFLCTEPLLSQSAEEQQQGMNGPGGHITEDFSVPLRHDTLVAIYGTTILVPYL